MSNRNSLKRQCVTCGLVFTPKRRGVCASYCSRVCWPAELVEHFRLIERSYESKRKGKRDAFSKTWSTCNVCGVEFRLMRGVAHRGRVVCYGECAKPVKPPKPPKPVRHCEGCSAVLPSDQHNRKWCSEKCRKTQYGSTQTEIEFRHCERCGKLFCCRAGRNVSCCSRNCAKRKAESIRRHRLRTASDQCDQITLFALGERDGWRCHLCGKKIPNRPHKGRPLDPEIDHLIPVSAGGAHVWENVALSHRSCNGSRGADGPAQLRLIA
jgi:hypothetical protein